MLPSPRQIPANLCKIRNPRATRFLVPQVDREQVKDVMCPRRGQAETAVQWSPLLRSKGRFYLKKSGKPPLPSGLHLVLAEDGVHEMKSSSNWSLLPFGKLNADGPNLVREEESY
jgi:hypothetical protein